MTLRSLASAFFLLYGCLIPITATAFMIENFVATFALIGSCIIISAIFWIDRARIFNIIIAVVVFNRYLTRPYVDLFLPYLKSNEIEHINGIN